MSYQTLRYEVDAGVATLTLSRPDQRNAVNGTVLAEMLDVLDRVDQDDAVRALIVTGDGPAFCAGADLSRGSDSFIDPASAACVDGDGRIDYSDPRVRDGGGLVTLRLYNLLKPVIGAINGPAVGLGTTMILPMDVRIASSAARFGFIFTQRGMVPEGASGFFLPRIVGVSRALEWCLAAEMVSAQEALDAGLVRAVVAPDALMPAARAWAAKFAANAPVSVALTRQMMWRGVGAGHPMAAHQIDSRGIAARSRSRDAAEGVLAWSERRPAVFADQVSRDMPQGFPWWDEPAFS